MAILKIFFSWQSDTREDTNRSLIWESLQRARVKVMEKYTSIDLEIQLDKDTQGESGSPTIDKTILDKIALSDIFIADITLINKLYEIDGMRLVPNPNVAFELGFATALLGEKRVILLYNSAYGVDTDNPFDYRQRRATPFLAQEGDDFNSRSNELTGKLVEAIKAVIDNNPPKPYLIPPQSREYEIKKRDGETLSRLLRKINKLVVHEMFDSLPLYMRFDTVAFGEELAIAYDYLPPIIGDEFALSLIEKIHSAWNKITSYSEFYDVNPHNMTYQFNPNSLNSEKIDAIHDLINEDLSILINSNKSLIKHIALEYVLEVDLAHIEIHWNNDLLEFRSRIRGID